MERGTGLFHIRRVWTPLPGSLGCSCHNKLYTILTLTLLATLYSLWESAPRLNTAGLISFYCGTNVSSPEERFALCVTFGSAQSSDGGTNEWCSASPNFETCMFSTTSKHFHDLYAINRNLQRRWCYTNILRCQKQLRTFPPRHVTNVTPTPKSKKDDLSGHPSWFYRRPWDTFVMVCSGFCPLI